MVHKESVLLRAMFKKTSLFALLYDCQLVE